jgi:hypothetical protein
MEASAWGVLVADLTEDQRVRLRQVLHGMLRERAGANGRAVLANAVNIGIGTKWGANRPEPVERVAQPKADIYRSGTSGQARGGRHG